MLIARSKRQTNIIEYLLYMYQIEDIIRSFQFNLSAIEATIISKHDLPEETKREMKEWYSGLIDKMQTQKLERAGHLQELKEIIKELQVLHDQLLTSYFDKQYIDLYDNAKTVLKELTVKSVGQQLDSQIDVAIHGVYGLLVLRLRQKEVSEETQNAMNRITAFLAHLAVKFHKRESGELELPKEQEN